LPLQWGRITEDAEIVEAYMGIDVDTQLQWSRITEDAEIGSRRSSHWEQDLLQWGRITEDAEILLPLVWHTSQTAMLQWGRITEDAEIRTARGIDHAGNIASMGPHH